MIAPENNSSAVDLRLLRKDGETRRDVGMAFAAARRPDRVTLGRLRLVQALLASPDGRATIDDATTADELTAGFADGGKWRGTVTRSIIADGLACIVGTTRSNRPSRHRGYVSVLSLRDRTAAAEYIRQTTAAFATSSAGTGEVATPDKAACRPGCQCQACEETRLETEVLRTKFLVDLTSMTSTSVPVTM